MDKTSLKPQLATDVDLTKLKFPVILSAKIDGVRGINLTGTLTGRSLKEFKNKFVTERFSGEQFLGIDGELALGEWTDARLCSLTTGFVNRKTARDGKPTESDDLVWWAFDYLAPHVVGLPYSQRLDALSTLVAAAEIPHLKLVPFKIAYSVDELEAFDQECLTAGFEGSIIRDPEGMHKSGRATVKGGSYLRLKRFIDFEGEVTCIEEAMENQNEAKTNELGRTERSSHQENLVPKGMLGMIRMRALTDVVHNGNVLIEKDQVVVVGPGNMDHVQRVHYWNNRGELIGQIGKAKFFPHGVKDKPRFPTFIGLRAEEDMS